MLGNGGHRIFDVRIFYRLSEIVFDDVEIASRGFDGAVTEDLLDDPDVDAGT